MDNVYQLITLISGISAGVSGLIFYFFKKYIDTSLSKELTHFKLELEQSLKKKHIVFQSLHEQRAEVIKELFEKLTLFRDSYLGWLMEVRDDIDIEVINEHYLKHLELQDELVKFYRPNSIFFPGRILHIIDNFMDTVDDLNENTNEILNRENVMHLLKDTNIPEKQSKMKSLMDKVSDRFDPIIIDVMREFQQLIGVE